MKKILFYIKKGVSVLVLTMLLVSTVVSASEKYNKYYNVYKSGSGYVFSETDGYASVTTVRMTDDRGYSCNVSVHAYVGQNGDKAYAYHAGTASVTSKYAYGKNYAFHEFGIGIHPDVNTKWSTKLP